MAQDAKRRLTADDWADEALRMVAERGVAGVAVEPIAARLGATKGSFYWHFTNRQALVEAALARWEQLHTDAVIAAVDDEPDPEARLRNLFVRAVTDAVSDRVELVLLGSIDDPGVGPVLRRVTMRRLEYIAAALQELGLSGRAAQQRAQLAYTIFLGQVQLANTVPDQIIEDRKYLDAVMTAVLGA